MILITGITGLTGKFLYDSLQKTNLEVKYLVRKTSDISWMKQGEKIAYGNLTEVDYIMNAMEDVDCVLHLAPRDLVVNIIEACKKREIERIIYVNSTGIYSKFKSSSNIDIMNEKIVTESGLTYTIIRPTMIYGNNQDGNIKRLAKIMNKSPIFPVLGNGEGLMHPIYAGDLGKFIVSVLLAEEKTRNKEYDVAGKDAIKYIDVLRNIAQAMDKKVVFFHIPYVLALYAGKVGERFPNSIVTYEKVLRLIEDKNFDYSLAREELGFEPISFEEGVKKEIEALRKVGFVK